MVFLVQKASGFWDTENWRPAVFFRQVTIRPRNRKHLWLRWEASRPPLAHLLWLHWEGCLDPPMPQLRALD